MNQLDNIAGNTSIFKINDASMFYFGCCNLQRMNAFINFPPHEFAILINTNFVYHCLHMQQVLNNELLSTIIF